MTQIKLRRDTSANFTSKNPVLGIGEPAYETDTKKLKIGDGTTAYTQLEYFSAGGGGSTDITATLPLKIVDGVISLEVDGQTIQIVDGKLHANLDELSNTVNTLSDDVGTAFDLINIAQTDIQSNTENITNLQNALSDKQDKFETQIPLSISSNSITTSVATGITETAESWTGGGPDKSVSVDISALNIDANSDWKIHLSGYLGNWQNSSANTNAFYIDTADTRIFNFWHGSGQFRLGFNTATFNRIPNPAREFYYEVIHQKDATQFTFDGTNLVSSDPLSISRMSQEMGQTPYGTLAGKGKLKSFGFPIYSNTFQRIDKDISKSYFEADGVKYPITSVQGVNTLKLGIGSGLSVVDGKLTANTVTVDAYTKEQTNALLATKQDKIVTLTKEAYDALTEKDPNTIYMIEESGGSTGGDKVTILSNEYTAISPVPTNGVWYQSPGNGYIIARFMSSSSNQFCQLAVNASGEGTLDDNSIYNQTAFSQGGNNGFTLLLPISSTQYYAINTNFGHGLQWARFVPFITA